MNFRGVFLLALLTAQGFVGNQAFADEDRTTRLIVSDRPQFLGILHPDDPGVNKVTAEVYDPSSLSQLYSHEFTGVLASCDFSRDGKFLLFASLGHCQVLDLPKNALWSPDFESPTVGASFLSGGSTFIVNAGTHLLECTFTARTIATMTPFEDFGPILMFEVAENVPLAVLAKTTLPAGRQSVWTWNFKTPATELRKLDGSVSALAVSEDGTLVAISQANSPSVEVISIPAKKPVVKIPFARPQVSLRISQDCKWIVCSSFEGPVSLISLDAKKTVKEFGDTAIYPAFLKEPPRLVLYQPKSNSLLLYDPDAREGKECKLKKEI